jgi:hypothetical protein
VLSLDMWRAIERTNALPPWLADVRRRLESVKFDALANAVARTREAADAVERHASTARGGAEREAGARRLAFAIGRVTAAVGMIEYAAWSAGRRQPSVDGDAVAYADRWARHDLARL